MNKEQLVKMGLTEEQATNVMKELDGNFVPKSRFNDVNNELKSVKEQNSTFEKQIEDLKKVNPEELKSTIETLQAENKALAEKHETERKNDKIDSALELAIVKAKGKNSKAIKALIDREKLSLKDDGSLDGVNVDDLTKNYPYLFETETDPQFAGAVPAGNSSGTGNTSVIEQQIDDIMKGI